MQALKAIPIQTMEVVQQQENTERQLDVRDLTQWRNLSDLKRRACEELAGIHDDIPALDHRVHIVERTVRRATQSDTGLAIEHRTMAGALDGTTRRGIRRRQRAAHVRAFP